MDFNETYQNAKNKSINNGHISIQKAKKAVKKTFIIGATLGILAAVSVGLGVNAFEEKVEFNDAIRPYVEIVNKNTSPTENGEHVWYDNYDIAEELNKDGKVTDLDIYGTYKAMSFNSKENMNEVIKVSFNKKGYSSMDDYVKGLGYVKESKPDYDSYEKDMKEKLILQSKLDKLNDKGDESSGYGM